MPETEQTYYPVGRALKALEALARIPPLPKLVVKFRLDDQEIRQVAFVVRVLLEIAELPPATMAEAEAYLGLSEFEQQPTFDALTAEVAAVAGDRDGGLYRARQMLAQIEPLSVWAAAHTRQPK